jgi:hypothetical protein
VAIFHPMKDGSPGGQLVTVTVSGRELVN